MKSAQFVISTLIMVLILFARAEISWADGASNSKDASSSNFNKTDQFLPGEEVVTPTGKKMKVYSTAGPVAVSPAPAPFEDREKSTLDGSNVIVDVDSLRELRDRRERDRREGGVPDRNDLPLRDDAIRENTPTGPKR